MRTWGVVAGATWMVGSACIVASEPMGYGSCQQFRRECAVAYSSFTGYYRACNMVSTPCYDPTASSTQAQEDDAVEEDEEHESSTPPPSAEPGTEASTEPEPSEGGGAPASDRTRYSAFDIPCERDNQCGPGKCLEGECYYGCNSDEQCGSGDRCAVESGTRICWPDPNPPVACTRSAQCDDGFACLNGSCRQSCTETEQCENLLDRCASGVCLPDRRPLSECVLNSECADGLVCLDGACVAACPAPAKDDVCLAELGAKAPADPGATPASEAGDPSTGDPSEPVDTAADAGAEPPTNSIQ